MTPSTRDLDASQFRHVDAFLLLTTTMPPRKRTRASVSAKREPSPASDSEISVISIASSDFKPGSVSSAASEPESAYESTPEPEPKPKKRKAAAPRDRKPPIPVADIEDGPVIARPHGKSYHDIQDVVAHQDALLEWFESVR